TDGFSTDLRAFLGMPVVTVSCAAPASPFGIGAVVSLTCPAAGGAAPYTWSISSGSLPPGLMLNSLTGLISGQPTVAGTYPFTIRVVDSTVPMEVAFQQVTLTIAPGLTITTTSLP